MKQLSENMSTLGYPPARVWEPRLLKEKGPPQGQTRTIADDAQAGPLLLNPLSSSLVHLGSLALLDFLLCCPAFLSCPCCPWERAGKGLEMARILLQEQGDLRHRGGMTCPKSHSR